MHYPLPVVQAENPISEEKFQLGRHLFYDLRLSGPANFSCASYGQTHPRSAQALVNIAYNASVNWGNPSTVTLEQQAPIPLFNEFPVEMGINDSNQAQILARLQAEPRYLSLFKAAFPNEAQPLHFANIAKALASFERGLNSFNSPFDQYEQGNQFAITD